MAKNPNQGSMTSKPTNVDPEPFCSPPPNNMDSRERFQDGASKKQHGSGEIKPSSETPKDVRGGVSEELRGSDEIKPSPETPKNVREGVSEKLHGSGNEIIESSLAHA